jgi:hypothetical protein
MTGDGYPPLFSQRLFSNLNRLDTNTYNADVGNGGVRICVAQDIKERLVPVAVVSTSQDQEPTCGNTMIVSVP